ncbi:PepSY-associated TM helix domain-containing protein [Paucibacter sp. O1-1]|nr:PepSY domain-containing protein [Paucibacter sp. O1-1]MDA3826961.1 PepSY-associated TM helix domain-containing protein [Paucibacter sp. O1-1]
MKSLLHRCHVWLGVAAGLVLLLLCLSGSLAMFRLEIGQWAAGSPGATGCAVAITADQAFEALQAQSDGRAPIRRLSLPALTGGPERGYYELRWADGRRAMLDGCGRPLAGNRAQVGDFLVNLHTRLFMGKQGRWIVGGIGVLMLASLISGLLVHRKLLSQWFTLRLGRPGQRRLALSDGHKLLGLWLLPFHLLTAVTGAWLGLATLIETGPPAKGVQAPREARYERPAVPLAPLLAHAGQVLPGLEPVYIDFFPERGHLSLRGNLPGHLVQRYSAELLFDGGSAQPRLLGVHDPRRLAAPAWWRQALMPLHMGDWLGERAGALLRWAYALLGLGTAALVWLGLRLWADRRTRVAGRLWPRGPGPRRLLAAATAGMAGACVLPWLVWALAGQGFALGVGAALAGFGVGAVLGLSAGSARGKVRSTIGR